MLFPYALLLLPLVVATERLPGENVQGSLSLRLEKTRGALEWMKDGVLHVVDAFFPVSRRCDSIGARKRKKHKLNKYVLPLIVGFLLIKSILLPIALKTLAILSGKAVVLSLMSLILAAIVGLKKVAQSPSGGNYEVVNLPPTKYRRQDIFDFSEDAGQNESYKYYKERRRKK